MAGASGKGSNYGDGLSARQDSLTAREEEVLEYAAKGKADKQMADSLSMAARTAEKHWEAIRKKLGVQNRGVAIYHYYQLRLDRKNQIISKLRKENARLHRRLKRLERPT